MRAGVPQLDNQIAAATVNNVFAFAPVKMHGCDLPVAHVHDFFRIAFGVRGAIWRTIAQGEKGEPWV
jgi:hypothetical protein